MATLSQLLNERGYVHQYSADSLETITDGPKRTVYLGIDPSADSLHVGNLAGLLVLRRFLEDGHKVIILTGGGTGMIGDPGGKSEERNLLDTETVESNSRAVAAQIRQVFGSSEFTEVNNAEWLGRLQLLDFLRDVGKHFTVNAMIKKDIVRDRLESETPISFTEFSYSLLQGYDYAHLNETYGCDVQVGGSDQWSNILAGVEYLRRAKDREVYALTWPLIVNKTTGKKFGKSESGAVWLDPKKTSPFQFYQFFLNADDEMAEELLLKLTLLGTEEIAGLMAEHADDPGARLAQRKLAHEVTCLVHGEGACSKAESVSEVLFGGADLSSLGADDIETLKNVAPSCAVQAGELIIDVLIRAGLASSKREARQFLSDGAVTISGAVQNEMSNIGADSFINDTAILRRGKRNVTLLTL